MAKITEGLTHEILGIKEFRFKPFAQNLEVLEDYANKHGSFANVITSGKNATTHIYNGKLYNIGVMISNYKHDYSVNKLTLIQVQILNNLGIDLTVEEYLSFGTKMEVLTDYANNHNGTIAKIKLSETYVYEGVEYPIGVWITHYRNSYYGNGKRNKLAKRKVEALSSLGMCWDAKKEYSFDFRFEVLKSYADAHGGTISKIELSDTHEYNGEVYNAGNWVAYFRRRYNNPETEIPLTAEEIKALEGIGIVWVAWREQSYDLKIKVLTDYAKKYGSIDSISRKTTYVYKGEEYPLGAWMNTFRNAYNGNKGCIDITEQQIQQLNALGMNWSKKLSFETKLEVLTEYYYDVNGGNGTIANIEVTETYNYKGKTYNIGGWITRFRDKYKGSKGGMPIHEIQALEKLGMVWFLKQSKYAKKCDDNTWCTIATK